MTAALTLPGAIPGLLRPCAPVVYRGQRAIVLYGSWMDGDQPRIEIGGLDLSKPIPVWTADVALDLSDPTGRAHAAWWASEIMDREQRRPPTLAGAIAVTVARHGIPMTDDHIAILRDLVLRLAGMTP